MTTSYNNGSTKHYQALSLESPLFRSLSSFYASPSENHILEDVNKCVIALQEGDVDTLDRTAGAIRGRAARVVHIINAEMENYEPGVYTERVLESIKLLSETGERTKPWRAQVNVLQRLVRKIFHPCIYVMVLLKAFWHFKPLS